MKINGIEVDVQGPLYGALFAVRAVRSDNPFGRETLLFLAGE